MHDFPVLSGTSFEKSLSELLVDDGAGSVECFINDALADGSEFKVEVYNGSGFELMYSPLLMEDTLGTNNGAVEI